MQFKYFAGAIFTTQEIFTFCVIAFIVIGGSFGLILFISKKLLNRARKNTGSNLGISKALLIGFGLLAVIILLFFVAPTMIKDNNWVRKQQYCAQKVGYKNPGDDNSNLATSESQQAYRNCLGL